LVLEARSINIEISCLESKICCHNNGTAGNCFTKRTYTKL